MKALKSDDVLKELNDEARKKGMEEQDDEALKQMRSEVARLLRLQGLNLGSPAGGETGNGNDMSRPARPHRPRPPLEPIEIHEPPTYIRIVADENREITFYPEQRRYIRVETDANSTYHNPDNARLSSTNVIVGEDLSLCGSTPLRNGRMRLIIEGTSAAKIGQTGTIRIELRRSGLPVLVDERAYKIVAQPDTKSSAHQVKFPQFKTVPVEGPDDPVWISLDWPESEPHSLPSANAGGSAHGVLLNRVPKIHQPKENI